MGNLLGYLIFKPHAPRYASNSVGLHLIETNHGSVLYGYFIDNTADITLLFSHGNGEDLGDIVPHFETVTKGWGVNLFAYDYSGYGWSTGTPSEEHIYKDIEAVYSYLRNKLNVPKNKIVAYGKSLGSAPTVHIAMKNEILGVILQSPLASIYRVVFRMNNTMPYDLFCNIDKIHKIKSPILFIHGTNDKLISYKGTKEMLSKTKVNTYYMFIEKAGHNDLELHFNNKLTEAITTFLLVLKNNIREYKNKVYNISNIDKYKLKSIFSQENLRKNETAKSLLLKPRNSVAEYLVKKHKGNYYQHSNKYNSTLHDQDNSPSTVLHYNGNDDKQNEKAYKGLRSEVNSSAHETLKGTVANINSINYTDKENSFENVMQKFKIESTHSNGTTSNGTTSNGTTSNGRINELNGRLEKNNPVCNAGKEKPTF